MNEIKVIVTGACGRMGQEVVRAVSKEHDMSLVGAVDAVSSGEDIGKLCGIGERGIKVSGDLKGTIEKTNPDVMVDFTNPKVVMDNLRTALTNKVASVVGTSGFDEAMRRDVEDLARNNDIGVVIAPNFSIGAILMIKFAKEAMKYLPNAEIMELHHDKKLDAPSATALRTAELMLEGRPSTADVKRIEEIEKLQNVRGGNLGGIRIHSIRLPGLVAHQEVILGGLGQILTIRHDSISRESFMPGVILAIRKIKSIKGLVYGLESLLE